jgi:vesicle transport through interaction with t-SNAREs protein 1
MAQPSSSLFATYERQYATTSTSVATQLKAIRGSVNPGRVSETARQLESQLKDAERTLQRMDMEARSATPQSASLAMIGKVKDYKRDYQTLLMDVRKVQQAQGGGGGDMGNRAELGLMHAYQTEAQRERDRLLTATDRLEQTGERIREGRKQLLETEVCVFVVCAFCCVCFFVLCAFLLCVILLC